MVRGQRNGRGRLMSALRRLGAGVCAALLVVLGAGVLEGGVPAFALSATTTTLMSAPNPSTVGQSVTFTATVTDGTSPTGTVAFSGGGISGCDARPLDGTGVATCTTSALSGGSGQAITATYSGDTDNATSFGTVSQTVNPGGSTTVLGSSPNPSTFGESVTFTATVTGSSPTGTVAFSGGGVSGCGARPLNGSGVATCTTAALPVENNQTVTATYSGDSDNATSFGTVSQTVTTAGTGTSLISAPNPSTFGESVTFTATVTGSSPTGTVAFSGGGVSGCAARPLNGSGVATCTTTTLPVETDQTVTASYSGDSNNNSSFATVSQTVTTAGSGTALVSSQNPSTLGQSVTFTATVTGSTPTGTVHFSHNGTSVSGCGTRTLVGGSVTCTTAALPVGNNQTIEADYSGDGNNATSSGTVSQTVNTVSSGTALISSQNPSVLGQSVTFTATVTGSTPTGTVHFSDNGNPIAGCGTRTLVGGSVTCTTAALPVGNNQKIEADYSGDGNNGSSSGSVSQSVDQLSTSTTVSSSTNPTTVGQSVSFLATVTPSDGSTPTGSVQFLDGTTPLGTVALGGGGLSSSALAPNQAELSTAALSQGTHSITVVYGGDANDLPSTSSPLNQLVNPQPPPLPATTTTLTVSRNPAALGQVVRVTATVTTTPPGGPITGTVQFFDGTFALGTIPLAGNKAVVSIEANVTGTYVLTASYSGDASNAPSTSAGVDQVAIPYGSAGTQGYWLVGSDGGIFTFGSAQFYGSTGALRLQRPVVGITPTSDLGGYWLVASDGGIFTFGDGAFFGSIPGLGIAPAGTPGAARKLNAPIVGMVPSADGGGYFMVGADGGVFAFGDAAFEGSCPGIGGCSGAAVAVMPDATGNGYWVVTASGYVYTFGDANYYGGPGPQAVPVTSAVATPDGRGYWILFSNGVIAGYGDAGNFGSPAGVFGGVNPATAIVATSDGRGYWVASANGSVYTFGDAQFYGAMAGTRLNGAIIAAAGF